MINVKSGTQTWNKPQRSDFKEDRTQNISAADKTKFFDDENLGDTLNKVADPNYVDPSKKMRTVGQSELGKDAFMSLLLTQMKNQDPTNPLKSHEMAAQLAQFTSLEKLHNINEGIDQLRKDQQPAHNFQALAFIGKTVDMDNSKLSMTEENQSQSLRFTLPADATKARIQIKDKDGNAIRTLDYKSLKAGANDLSWNGKTDEGSSAPVGDYTMSVEAFGSNGKKLYVMTKADGVITGVNFTAQGPQLMMGKQVINMADVKSIRDAQMEQAELPAVPTTAQAPQPTEAAPNKTERKAETKPNAIKAAKLAKGNLNDASMAQGLINNLNKEGAKAGMGTE